MDKNRSASTQQIIDTENPDIGTRPPAPLPSEIGNVACEEDYDDPDELSSVQWPSPYDEIRDRSKPPTPPPARKTSTTSIQTILRSISCPTSPPSAVTAISATDSEVPDVPKKKSTSFVIQPFKDKPLTPTFDTKAQQDRPFSSAAYEKGEHQYGNLPSPRPEPKSPSDTHLMPPIAEANEQSNSDRSGLPKRESCDSIVLDPHGYIKFIASEGERLSEEQPVPDGPSSSAVLNSPVHEPREPSDNSLIPTDQCVSSKPGLSQRESCDSIALDPQGYVKCIS